MISFWTAPNDTLAIYMNSFMKSDFFFPFKMASLLMGQTRLGIQFELRINLDWNPVGTFSRLNYLTKTYSTRDQLNKIIYF